MYSNKSYFIFAIGAGIWVIMKLKHILGLLKKEKAWQTMIENSPGIVSTSRVCCQRGE